MRLGHWVLLTTVARTPAIAFSAMGGNAVGTESYEAAVVFFLGILIISGIGLVIYRGWTENRQPKE